jgi:hypothetical protein
MLVAGYLTTSLHWLFVVLQLVATVAPRPSSSSVPVVAA